MRYLIYHGPMTEAGARNVEILLTTAVNEHEPEVTLCISSHGGDVNAGIGLYNFIKMLPIKVYTHAMGICDSIAVTVLLAGINRTANPLSAFVTHAATYTDHSDQKVIAPNTDLVSQPFREILGWSDEDVSKRFTLEDFRFKPERALELGVISSIVALQIGNFDLVVHVSIP